MPPQKKTALTDLENMKLEVVDQPKVSLQEALELLNGKVRLQVPELEPEE